MEKSFVRDRYLIQ